MGIAASIAEERRLFDTLVHEICSSNPSGEGARGDEVELARKSPSQDENSLVDAELEDGKESGADPAASGSEELRRACSIVRKWRYEQEMHRDVVYCPLVDVQVKIAKAFSAGRTPLILDSSPDNKVATFYTYQSDSIILSAKVFLAATIQAAAAKSRASKPNNESPVEVARKTLVNAMKNGKLMLIHMETSALDLSKICEADSGVEDQGVSSFPREVLFEGGTRLKGDYWPRKLFREEDMLPHRNFAYCKDDFRVAVLSRMSLESVHQHLFRCDDSSSFPQRSVEEQLRNGWEAPLPDRRHFQIIVIDYGSNANDGSDDL